MNIGLFAVEYQKVVQMITLLGSCLRLLNQIKKFQIIQNLFLKYLGEFCHFGRMIIICVLRMDLNRILVILNLWKEQDKLMNKKTII